MGRNERVAENRIPIRNLAYTSVHWLFAVLLSIISFMVQYSFLVDTGETYSSFIFSGSIYRVNFVTFPIGVALFLVGFYVIWKKYLAKDWDGFNGRFWIWKVAYVIIALVALAAMLVTGAIVLFLYTGLTGDITPEWAMWGFVAFPIYVVLVASIDFISTHKREKRR